VEKVCVLGAGSTKYGKLADSIGDITTQASVAAIDSAELIQKRSKQPTFLMYLEWLTNRCILAPF